MDKQTTDEWKEINWTLEAFVKHIKQAQERGDKVECRPVWNTKDKLVMQWVINRKGGN